MVRPCLANVLEDRASAVPAFRWITGGAHAHQTSTKIATGTEWKLFMYEALTTLFGPSGVTRLSERQNIGGK